MENFEKKDRIIIYLGVLLPILSLISFIVLKDYFETPLGEPFLKNRKEIYFNGIIDSIYRQKDNHNVMTIVSNGAILEIDGEWESKFIKGDSVIKTNNTIFIKIFRKGALVDSLNYSDITKY